MRWDVRRIVLVALGACGLLSGALAALGLYHEATGIQGLAFEALEQWTIPLSSLMVIAGVGWLLLSQTPSARHGHENGASMTCGTCGRTVMRDWRMCPYCGASLEPASGPPAESPTRA